MPCFYPMEAYKLSGGEISFKERGDILRVLQLPCGKCIGCRLERSREWAVRCMHEAQMHEESSFITLTYDPEHYEPSLNYGDFQRFMYRLRKRLRPRTLRFFMCGEYGELHKRPHFHALIFGYSFRDDRLVHSKSRSGATLYRSPFLSEIWTLGFASVGELSFDSAAYVARYAMKKITGAAADEAYRHVDLRTGEIVQCLPEFAHMSLKPGIGATWFAKYTSDVFERDYVVVDGMKLRPPRYYKDLLRKQDPESDEFVDALRAAKRAEVEPDDCYERLRVRETVTRARIGYKFRTLE